MNNSIEDFNELLGAEIIADDGIFLGIVSKDKNDSQSVSNPYGDYGNKHNPLSIMNPFGLYGSKYSSQSAFNENTWTPPHFVKDDQVIGYLTLNKWIDGAVNTNEFFRWLAVR